MPNPLPTPTPPKPPTGSNPAGAPPPAAPPAPGSAPSNQPANSPAPKAPGAVSPTVPPPQVPKPTTPPVAPAPVNPTSQPPVAPPRPTAPLAQASQAPKAPVANQPSNLPPARPPQPPPKNNLPPIKPAAGVPAPMPGQQAGLPPTQAAPAGRPNLPARPGQPAPTQPLPPRPGANPTGGALPPRPPGAGPLPPRPAAGAPGSLPPAAAPKTAQTTTVDSRIAKPKSSIFKFLPFIIGGLALLGVVIFFIMRMLGGGSSGPTTGGIMPTEETTLTYWGLWEPSDVMQQVFADFEAANPGVKVNYVQQSPTDYRERLQTAISQGTGPDLFRFHASWTPMLRDDLSAVPANVFSTSTFQNTFYPVASEQLTYNGSLRGIPLMYDGLALYYNEEILRTADAQPPQTWADLRILATNLTVTTNGQVERGGLAIGNATNVEHFSDILGLLMMQNGADLSNPSSPEAREALIFYTDFLKTYKVWSNDLPSSTVAFARGDAAMMFAPSWRAHEILAQNPNLTFGMAPVPKLGTSQAAWATYWAEGVNEKSRNKDAAWKLLAYMSQADVMQKLYADQASVRKFGELYSRRDLADQLAGDPMAAAFLSDAPQAKGWYMSSFTHDNGINDQIIKYYQDAITAVLDGTNPDNALQTVTQGVSQVLRTYGVPTTAPVTAPGGTTGAPAGTNPGAQLSL